MATKRLFFTSCMVLIALTGSGTALWGQGAGFVYVADRGGFVSAYSINGTTGALTPVPGSPFPAGSIPRSVTVDPTGQFAYVANCGFGCGGFGSGNVSAYVIKRTGGLLPLCGSPFPAGSTPRSVTVDPTGQFAYVANSGSDNVWAYSIDGATGALTPVADSPFRAGSQAFSVTVDPTGQFAYVANCGSSCGGTGLGNVSAYTIDGTTGALTPLAGSPFSAGTGSRSVAVDPTGQFAYVANSGSANVSAYSIDGTTGALTPVGNFPAGSAPRSVTTTAGPCPPAF